MLDNIYIHTILYIYYVTSISIKECLALRSHSFAFIASLPDESKDYLTQLKAIRDQAACP